MQMPFSVLANSQGCVLCPESDFFALRTILRNNSWLIILCRTNSLNLSHKYNLQENMLVYVSQ